MGVRLGNLYETREFILGGGGGVGSGKYVLIKLGNQFAGHPGSTVGLDTNSHIWLSFTAEAGLVMVLPWAFCHESVQWGDPATRHSSASIKRDSVLS